MPNAAHRACKPRAAAPVVQKPAPIMETVASVGARLSCGRTTVYRLIQAGKLRTVKLSARAVRVVSADVEALLNQPAAH